MPITRVPVRLQIMRAITDALKEINPDNGYEFDLRDDEHGAPRVVRGRLHYGDNDPLPLVSIVEPPLSPDPMPTQRQTANLARVTDWDLIVQGWAQDDPNNPTDIAYQMEAEVRRRLALSRVVSTSGEATILGFSEGVILNMAIGSPVVRPNEHISEQAVFYLVLTLQIAEDMGAPLG